MFDDGETRMRAGDTRIFRGGADLPIRRASRSEGPSFVGNSATAGTPGRSPRLPRYPRIPIVPGGFVPRGKVRGHKLERCQRKPRLGLISAARPATSLCRNSTVLCARAIAPASTPGLLPNVRVPWLTTVDTDDFPAMPESLPT